MRIDLHVGPHRTATTWIQWSAHANREALAARGLWFVNEPAQCTTVARCLVDGRPDAAIEAFGHLLEAARGRFADLHPEPRALYSTEVFFEARRGRAAEFEAGFRCFVEALRAQGHAVRLVFVERDPVDLLVSNALLQASLGNLKYLSNDPLAFTDYLETYQRLKGFYFGNFEVAHLGFDAIVRGGDAFANFLRLAFDLDLAGAAPVPEGVDARNGVTDLQVARGLLLAPMINWVELFGSVTRFEMFNANPRLEAPVSDEALAAIVERVPLVRDCMRAMARRAVDLYLHGDAPARA